MHVLAYHLCGQQPEEQQLDEQKSCKHLLECSGGYKEHFLSDRVGCDTVALEMLSQQCPERLLY